MKKLALSALLLLSIAPVHADCLHAVIMSHGKVIQTLPTRHESPSINGDEKKAAAWAKANPQRARAMGSVYGAPWLGSLPSSLN